MIKNMKSAYKPGARVGHMLKVKPEERDLDLVITGGEYGTGKRSGWLSSFILSCKDGNKFLEIGKVGTGILKLLISVLSFGTLAWIWWIIDIVLIATKHEFEGIEWV